ncbi:Cas9 inhibitor AcrIIA9 family protein [Flavobacterium sp. YJ01]|uniref:Cas9 inhibitor AcrIIA9 family protein n=1 Tax=Flavobacterium sp. YJ01 TaxID=3031997 RepID=UPI0023E47375|nr:Cas9 inhibitor AcrIIA9 family protein [Flavobacterium sp. YJ01]WET03961.1 Cas9 inhibitor AcrIIA9 family protein [Flavobacterium sp. YJ01]
MKGSEKFKTRIEDFLKEKSQSDSVFAPMLEKASKNLENCFKYIISEVQKTGECSFDDSEIFDMAVKYYTDDTIGNLPDIKCRVTTNQPKVADLFSAPAPIAENPVQKNPAAADPAADIPLQKTSKQAQTTLTLFDL